MKKCNCSIKDLLKQGVYSDGGCIGSWVFCFQHSVWVNITSEGAIK